MGNKSDRSRGSDVNRGEDMKIGERNDRLPAVSPFTELNERSREIFRLIVDGFVQTGEPIGSRTLSRLLGQNLSPATIRNVMADLEEAGVVFFPPTSARGPPAPARPRPFLHGLPGIGQIAQDEGPQIQAPLP